uniref:Caspase domain-containing protein n=1 Tax=Candidatus Kentrum sp. FW TaxID=2126338 RepID=A0A450SX39_9GAMM|nr:MAG: Caspase domain-containing protein [Candidatus Kentron sp. FW]
MRLTIRRVSKGFIRAPGGNRHSRLVIGNGDYQQLDELANPKRDARAMAARLARLGFTLFDADGKETSGAV